MNSTSSKLKGRCRCGQVEFEVSDKPMITLACHCTGCQKMTSSAFSLGSLYPIAEFSIVSGEPVIGGLHGAARHYFCGHCMSWLFTRPEGMDDLVSVRSSMLENFQSYRPFVETYTDEKLEWAITGAKYSFCKFPPREKIPEILQEYDQQRE